MRRAAFLAFALATCISGALAAACIAAFTIDRADLAPLARYCAAVALFYTLAALTLPFNS